MFTRSQFVRLALFVIAMTALSSPSWAQSSRVPAGVSAPRSNSDTAVVLAAAPIYLLPDASREPLRVASGGSVLRVIEQSNGWCNVQFQDPQYGLRTGYIELRHVRIQRRELEPLNLSVSDTPTGETPVDRARTAAARDAADVPQAPTRQTEAHSLPPQRTVTRDGRPDSPWPDTRQGFWFNAGLGYGSGSCADCVLRYDGLSGGLTFGGRLSDRWLMGVGTTGWTRTSIYGGRVSVGTMDARFRFYPARTSGFFLTMGLGLGSISVDGESELGVGSVLGLGWDIRVGRKVSLTPFWNGFAVATSSDDANVGQLGLGITVH